MTESEWDNICLENENWIFSTALRQIASGCFDPATVAAVAIRAAEDGSDAEEAAREMAGVSGAHSWEI